MSPQLKSVSLRKVPRGAWRWSIRYSRASGACGMVSGRTVGSKEEAEADAMFAAWVLQYEA